MGLISAYQIKHLLAKLSFCRALTLKQLITSLERHQYSSKLYYIDYTCLIAWHHPSPEGNICPTLVPGTL